MRFVFTFAALAISLTGLRAAAQTGLTPVLTVDSFVRAETDFHFSQTVRAGGFGRLVHRRNMVSVDRQGVVRMNRDTLYSEAVFDLDAGPVTITLPDPGKRFMSMLVIDEGHYAVEVALWRCTRTAEFDPRQRALMPQQCEQKR